jgi:hypothetical protein
VKWSWCLVAIVVPALAWCQNTESVGEHQSLTLQTTGHGYWKEHRPFVVRVYSTSDGTKAEIRYLTFHSLPEANQTIATCLKFDVKVIYRNQNKDANGNVVGERIVAVRQESGQKDFTLIRRVGMNGYFIGSSSLAAAIQVEEEAIAE